MSGSGMSTLGQKRTCAPHVILVLFMFLSVFQFNPQAKPPA